jgi:hypothetical protein
MIMRKITALFVAIATLLMAEQSAGQNNKPASPEETIEAKFGGVKTKIVYCRPSAKGRKIMGKLVPFGEVWRTGANEATSIEFDKPVKIEGKDLPAGKYALFTIPNENEWTIIINKNFDQMGAYNYSQSDDVLRVNVKPSKTDKFVETFTIYPSKDAINLDWENTHVAFKVN